MAVINLRDVPDDLYHQLKSEAIERGQTFRAYCLAIFTNRSTATEDFSTAELLNNRGSSSSR